MVRFLKSTLEHLEEGRGPRKDPCPEYRTAIKCTLKMAAQSRSSTLSC